MSGFEVVGLVLGVWPVVLNLATAIKAGKDNSSVKALTWKVATYEKIFKQSIRKLLQGDEDLSEKDKVGLIEGGNDFNALWSDPEFAKRLEKRLDKDTIGILKHSSEEISKILEKLRAKVEKTVEANPVSQEDNAPERRSTLRTKFTMREFNIRAVRLALQTPEVSKLLTELKQHVEDVRILLEGNTITTYSGVKPDSSGHRRSLAGEQRRQFFDDFHETLSLNYTCQCGRAHEASLRISDGLEIVFPTNVAGRTLSTELHMRPRAATLDSQMTTIRTTEMSDSDEDSDAPRTTWSKSRKRSSVSSTSSGRSAFLVSFNLSRGVGDLSPIPDLCQWINMHRESPPSSPLRTELEGVVGPGNKRYTMKPLGRSPATIISMDDCLSGNEAALTRRIRLELAFNLASAIEHFHPTAWIDVAWTWRNFSMMREDNKTHRLCITGRFWSVGRQQSRITAPAASKFWRNLRHKDPMLVRLGFALIELALGTRLSDIRASMNGGVADDESETEWQKDMDDWITANDLIEADVIQDEVSPMFQQIVARCLQCEILEDSGVRPLKSGSRTFEDDLDRFVVQPLRDYHSNTWGQIAQIAVE